MTKGGVILKDLKFLEDAVIDRIKYLLITISSDSIPKYAVSGAKDELYQLVEFAHEENFTVPHDADFEYALKGL